MAQRLDRIIFCADPLAPRRPDLAYAAEVMAVEALGLPYDLVDFEALVQEDDPTRAVRRVAAQPLTATALYRGWMLTPARYRHLYDALLARGVRLLNDPAAYRRCHWLPGAYPTIAPQTPRSVWLPLTGDGRREPPFDAIMALLRPFGDCPLVVKDYVKSRKHEWVEACFIPAASDRAAVERVVRRLLALQGDDLNEGLVFREFVAFERLSAAASDDTPAAREWRTFFLHGEPVYTVAGWAGDDPTGEAPDITPFLDIARRLGSNFFAMDVARRRDGTPLIVEVGDGQVAGLPERADPAAFYRALADHPDPEA